MRLDEIKPEGIEVEPSKTKDSSGQKVMIPMGDDLKKVPAKIKRSQRCVTFVIHTEHG
jgi:hypothetical protein